MGSVSFMSARERSPCAKMVREGFWGRWDDGDNVEMVG